MEALADSYRARIGVWVKARLMRNPRALQIDCEGLDLFVVSDAIDDAVCDAVMALIDAGCVPSPLMGPDPVPDFRTSYTCNFDPADPVIAVVERAFHDVVGIQPEHGETVQGQRYAVGQQFKPHWDAFFPTAPYWPEIERSGGQRTWTAMLFLNEPESGGHTAFPEAGINVRPRRGNMLVWNNLTPNGGINPLAKHQGTPVTGGLKYVLTKWYRERPWVAVPNGQDHYH